MTRIARYDQVKIKGEATVTPEGYIKADAIVTRCGVFRYKNSDGSIRREFRCPDEVFNKDSLESIKMIPVTNGHPKERLVTADNAKELAVGFTGETIENDGNYVLSRLLITDAKTVKQVLENERRELSLGYTVDLDETQGVYDGEEYDCIQKNIRYNHLSLVDIARAGSSARIALDSQDAEEVTQQELVMTKVKLKIDSEEVMVDPSTKSHYEKLVEDMKNLSDEKARVEREMARIQGELEKTQGERDALQEKANPISEENKPGAEMDKGAKMDSAQIQELVKQRVSLEKKAEKILDRDVLAKLDSMSDMDVKKAIIIKKSANMKLDGKSKIYIDAAFDFITQEDKSEVKYKTQATTGRADRAETVDPEASRNKMINRMTNPGAE